MAIHYWYWFTCAGALLIAEMLTMTTFALYLALTAALIGLITMLWPNMHIDVQLGLAGLFAIISVLASYYTFKIKRRNAPTHCNRMSQYIGQTFTLTQDVKDGISKVKIGDTYWRVKISEGLQGDAVSITDSESTTFIAVKKAQ